MRETLFRGKRIDNGEWVEGYYAHIYANPNRDVIITGRLLIYSDGATNSENYHVDPETVGQYTGLTDKNGKKIFEGDFIKINFAISLMYGVVVFINGGFYIKTAELGLLDLCATGSSRKIEVVGNIYDNPELLEEIE